MNNIRTEHQQRIDAFMRLAGQDIPETPTDPGPEVRKLRARLILEEALEAIEGLGVTICPTKTLQEHHCISKDNIRLNVLEGFNLIEIVDGCADISVVTIGTLSAFGLSDSAILEAVDKNNLAKFGPGGYRDKGGKWIKPPGHQPPDFATIIAEQSGTRIH